MARRGPLAAEAGVGPTLERELMTEETNETPEPLAGEALELWSATLNA